MSDTIEQHVKNCNHCLNKERFCVELYDEILRIANSQPVYLANLSNLKVSVFNHGNQSATPQSLKIESGGSTIYLSSYEALALKTAIDDWGMEKK